MARQGVQDRGMVNEGSDRDPLARAYTATKP